MNLADHFAKKAEEQGATVLPFLPYDLMDQAFAIVALAQVTISPVVDEATFAVAMHELGHCATGHFDRKIEAERAAWAWAESNSPFWSATMESVKRAVMGDRDVPGLTYERQCRLDEEVRMPLAVKAAVTASTVGSEKISDFMQRRQSPRWRKP